MFKKFNRLAARISLFSAIVASAVILFGCFFSNASYALEFSQISQVYFFGDSLTDSGFNDLWPLPPGKAPTFTTFGGYTWSQYVARDIKGFVLPVYPGPNPPDTITNNSIYATTPIPGFVSGTKNGIDYAAAGSTTNSIGLNETWAPSLHSQVAYYLSKAPQTLDPNAVYFIWSGANDLLKLLLSAPPFPTELQFLQTASAAAVNIANEVAALSARGAKRFVILSLPNIGYTPLIEGIAAQYNLPTLPAQMKTITFTFNSMLNTALGRVIAGFGAKVLYVDVFDLLDKVIADTQVGKPYVIDGQAFLFVDYKDPACGAFPAIECPSTAPNNFIFADTLHPSGMAHRLLSLKIEKEIQHWR